MRYTLKPVALVAVTLFAYAGGAAAQADFEWRGQMAPGQSIEIKGINGNIGR